MDGGMPYKRKGTTYFNKQEMKSILNKNPYYVPSSVYKNLNVAQLADMLRSKGYTPPTGIQLPSGVPVKRMKLVRKKEVNLSHPAYSDDFITDTGAYAPPPQTLDSIIGQLAVAPGERRVREPPVRFRRTLPSIPAYSDDFVEDTGDYAIGRGDEDPSNKKPTYSDPEPKRSAEGDEPSVSPASSSNSSSSSSSNSSSSSSASTSRPASYTFTLSHKPTPTTSLTTSAYPKRGLIYLNKVILGDDSEIWADFDNLIFYEVAEDGSSGRRLGYMKKIEGSDDYEYIDDDATLGDPTEGKGRYRGGNHIQYLAKPWY